MDEVEAANNMYNNNKKSLNIQDLEYNPLYERKDQYKDLCKEQLRTKFVGLVENCLNRRRRENHQLTCSFKLYLQYFYGQPTGNISPEVIDGWLNSVTKTNTLKELDICIKRRHGCATYRIPESVLSNVSSSLTILRLEGINLNPNSVISFPSLTTLSLTHPEFEDFRTIGSLISRCPAIEDLHLTTLRYLSHKNNAYTYNEDLYVIDLITSSSSSVCRSLTSLSLCKVKIIDSWLEDVTFGLPFLERLTLDSCDGLKDSNIRSQSLKNFYYYCYDKYEDDYSEDRCDIESATFDTPNLVCFNYKGYETSTFWINSPKLLEADVKLLGHRLNKNWYLNLILFLSCLNCSSSTTLRLYVPWKKALLIPEIIKRVCCPPLPDLKHLIVKIQDTNDMRYLMQQEYKDDDDEELINNEEINDDFSIDSPESRAALLWSAPSAVTHEIEYAFWD